MRSPYLAASLLLATAVPAAAHFKLVAPSAMSQQNTYGDPQKSAPCGQDDQDDPWVPTSAVTTVQTGTMLTVTIDETIFHAGHYRVALAQTMAQLPDDPLVTTTPQTACGSTTIATNPTLPLLADGMLVHSSRFSSERSFQVQLPPGMECTNCVLQVTEFMTDHAAPCFYHHCATITVSNSAPPPADAGTSADGGGAGTEDPSGCCGVGGGAAGSGLLALGVAALLSRRARRGA